MNQFGLLLWLLITFSTPGMEAENHTTTVTTREAKGAAMIIPLFTDRKCALEGAECQAEFHGTIVPVKKSTMTLTVGMEGGSDAYNIGPDFANLCVFPVSLGAQQVSHVIRYAATCTLKEYFVDSFGSKGYAHGQMELNDEESHEHLVVYSTAPDSQPGLYDVGGFWGCSFILEQTEENALTVFWGHVFRLQ